MHIKVSRYDKTSRDSESHRFRIGVGRRDYQGTEVIDIDSVLTFQEHCQFVKTLIQALKKKEGAEKAKT
jgi:hypothetical protein